MFTSLSQIAIIPNIHPVMVHFTVALMSISFILYAMGFIFRRLRIEIKFIQELGIVARWCLWLTLFFSILTVAAGLQAYFTVPHDEEGHLAMGVHMKSAIVTFTLIVITSVFSIMQYRKRIAPNISLLALLTITKISVLITAYLGAEVVYRYGIGVIKAQTKEMMGGHHHGSGSGHGGHNHGAEEGTDDHNSSQSSQATNKIPLYWIDPMEPNVHYPKGGTSPMGMALVPVYPKDGADDLPENTIKLPQSYINNLGVKTTAVISSNGNQSFSAYGNLESNEGKVSFINSYSNAWVRNLLANTQQMPIKKGQLLAQIFSPTVVNAENEYQAALISKNNDIIVAAKNKLLSLHVDPIQINQITATSQINQLINIYSPQNGILSSLNIKNGDYITPDKQLFAITDLSSVWMIANIFENQIDQVKVGMPVKVTINGLLGRTWPGKVEYIYPQIDNATRTARVRVVLNNPDLTLKPGMYGNVLFNTGNNSSNLMIPTQSIIMSTTENRVVVSLGNGMFQVRKITLGNEVGDMTQVISGLSLGEQVVTNGEFMIDSEASLSAGMSRIDSAESNTTAIASTSKASNTSMQGMNMSKDMDMSNGMDMTSSDEEDEHDHDHEHSH